MDWLELLKGILQVILYTVITGCGVIVVKKIVEFLNGKVDELQANTKLAEYEKINKIIDKAQLTVSEIVTSVNQVFVDSLKAKGEFTKESATIAKDSAIDKATELINEEAVKAIEEVHGNFNSWLDVTIEKAVKELKK